MEISLPPGINNPSNYCYIISTIQCLKNIKSIRKFINNNSKFDQIITAFLNGFGLKVMNKDNFIKHIEKIEELIKNKEENVLSVKNQIIKQLHISENDFTWFLNKIKHNNTNMYMYFAFLNLIKKLFNRNNTVLDMKEFIMVFRIVSVDNGNQYISMGQNDASEFLVFLIDYFHEGHTISGTFTTNNPDENKSDTEIEQMPLTERIRIGFLKNFKSSLKDNYTSLIPDIHHYILNMITCHSCGYANLSYSMENILCLSLYQKDNQNETLSIYDTLDKHFEDEELEGYSCDKCKNKEGNKMSKMLLTNPDTFIICLKRTGYNPNTMGMEKINVKVEYPMMINLNKYYPEYMNSTGTEGIYKLTGVVNQVGDNNFGHYFSFVYDDILDKWLCCNDDRVNLMNESIVVNSNNAYLLFYQK
jgi:ubiquitin C-terminal hydrolase